MAQKNADVVRRLNPAHSGDLSGYKYLDQSTVLPLGLTETSTNVYTLRLGLIANESRPTGQRTVLYCGQWIVNTATQTVDPRSGRELRTIVGYVGLGDVRTELQQSCG